LDRVIFHIDLDAFYTSVEEARNPALKGRPVVVAAHPGKRGVIAGCNYEARKRGLRSGFPITRAKRICPECVLLPPNLLYYNEVSQKIMGTLKQFADKFEQTGIDEAFLDVSHSSQAHNGKVSLAKLIKQIVKDKFGISCSIGIGPNKSVAKIASDLSKPDGLFVVEVDKVSEFLEPLPVSKISGVGKKTESLLNRLGVRTIGDLSKIPGKELVRVFGRNGVWLWGISHGLERVEVEETRETKSIGNEHTFEEDVSNRNYLLDVIDGLSEVVAKRVENQGIKFRTVCIKVRFEDFETSERERTLPSVSSSSEVIRSTARQLFREFWNDFRKIRLLGVRVTNTVSNNETQTTLEGD
jgi:DNA polymerase IV (DinB-like DNA polymerase)